MILSRVMREKDYDELKDEGRVITELHDEINMWHDTQHHHRLWEYALAQKALKGVYGDYGSKIGLRVADFGCGAGYLSPILYKLGHHVFMYDCWTFPNQEEFAMEQMRRIEPTGGSYEMRNRSLGSLVEEDKGMDAAFCISTLEHIKDYRKAFRDLLSTVKPRGLVFLTTDFGTHETDDYKWANLRAGKMFTADTYNELYAIARGLNFATVQGAADWKWDESCRLVSDYGFASMALWRLS
jgi:2-polyprenyl-3-methyl-5-hydroxy-6-metoxy-1,4-benzoquinol methylase